MSGNGSQWTKKYEPIKIFETIENCDGFNEDKYVLKMMSIHGIDNVRGGSYVQIELPNEEKILLQKRLNMALNRCANCGSDQTFY